MDHIWIPLPFRLLLPLQMSRHLITRAVKGWKLKNSE